VNREGREKMRTVNTMRSMGDSFEMGINELEASIRSYMADGMSRDMATEKAMDVGTAEELSIPPTSV
jgi:hypothetical protein